MHSQHKNLIEKIKEVLEIERKKRDSILKDKVSWSYHQGKVHQLEDIITLLLGENLTNTNKE